MAMSSALIGVMFAEWTCNYLITELSAQIYTTAIATWDFLMPPSAMIAILLWFTWDDLKVRLRLWKCWWRSLSEEEEGEWKLNLLEKWSTIWEPGEKRGWRELKQLLTLLRYSLTSLIGLLRLAYCFIVSLEVVVLWGVWFLACWESSKELMAYKGGIEV